jgi:hypothetical protein
LGLRAGDVRCVTQRCWMRDMAQVGWVSCVVEERGSSVSGRADFELGLRVTRGRNRRGNLLRRAVVRSLLLAVWGEPGRAIEGRDAALLRSHRPAEAERVRAVGGRPVGQRSPIEEGFDVADVLGDAVGGKALKEDFAVALTFETGIEKHEHAPVVEGADEAAKALLEGDDG